MLNRKEDFEDVFRDVFGDTSQKHLKIKIQ